MDDTQGSGPAPGTVLDGRYELVTPLWRDGAIQLHEAHDRVLKRAVAVKLCHDGTPAERARFEAEVRWLARSSGPGRVRVYDTGRHGEDQFAVVEMQDILTAPDQATAPILLATGALTAELTGDTTQVVGQRHDTAVLPLPAIAPVEPLDLVPDAERRRRRGLFALGAAAAAAAAVVLAVALAGGGPDAVTPPVAVSSTTLTTVTAVTVPKLQSRVAQAPTTTATTVAPSTTVGTPTTASGFPFDGSGPPGLGRDQG